MLYNNEKVSQESAKVGASKHRVLWEHKWVSICLEFREDSSDK